jgi:subtilisin family serine protease
VTVLAFAGCGERVAGPLGAEPGEEPGSVTPPRRHIGGSAPGDWDRPSSAPSVPGELVVQTSLGVDVETLNATWGTTTILELEGGTHALVRVPEDESVHTMSTAMMTSGDCDSAEPNWVSETPETQQGTIPLHEGDKTSQDVEDQNALNRIGNDLAHTVTTGGGVTIAILDTGIDATHPDLASSVSPIGWDFIDEDAIPADERHGLDADADGLVDEAAGHGTHVAGLVHAVAPGATLMAVRVLDSEGYGTSVSVARGILFAVANGADVINLSLGMYVDSDVIKYAIETAGEAGVIVVTAGGNRGMDDEDHFPSRLHDTIGVAATDSADLKASFSNFGSSIDVSAPGVGILSTFLDHGYATWSGTSMATPLVAGGAALALSAHTGSDPESLGEVLVETADGFRHEGLIYDGKLGSGRLALAAVVEFQTD